MNNNQGIINRQRRSRSNVQDSSKQKKFTEIVINYRLFGVCVCDGLKSGSSK